MADNTQSATQTIISHQALTHPGSIEGSPVAVASWISGDIVTRIANVEVTANATGVMVWVQGSFETTGDDAWFTLAEFVGTLTAAETEALTATEAAGEQTIALASTTNLVVSDLIYLQDTTVVGDGEWHKIIEVTTNVSIDIDYGLGAQKDSSDFVFTEAEIFKLHISDVGGLKRINVLVIHEAATGSDLHVLSEAVFITDFE